MEKSSIETTKNAAARRNTYGREMFSNDPGRDTMQGSRKSRGGAASVRDSRKTATTAVHDPCTRRTVLGSRLCGVADGMLVS
jgi:hypothetical protein